MGFFDRFRKKGKAPSTQAVDSATSKELEAVKKVSAEAATDAVPLKKAEGGSLLSFRLLRRPHVSEKAARLMEKGTYVFDVDVQAEKRAIKKAVESLYKVTVVSVRTVRHQGKPVRRGRVMGRRNVWKKALVTLKAGQKIDLYEGV